MATVIRPELSTKNKYYIDKHRYYELKHFCLQYPLWKNAYAAIDDSAMSSSSIENVPTSNTPGDPTGNKAVLKAYYRDKMTLIEEAAWNTDSSLYYFILKAVTEELSYTYLRTKMSMPCGRDMYYDRYRRFFWLLNHARG